MKPWMSEKDVKSIEHCLDSIAKPHISVLEWGSGGSTKHFSEYLLANGKTYDWLSLEYNKKWAEKVRALALPDVSIVLFDVGNDELRQRNTNMDEYVAYPATLNKKFDFVLVDGRKRRRCLLEAAKMVSSDGVVLLHDADRKYYHCAFAVYKTAKFLSKTLWKGTA